MLLLQLAYKICNVTDFTIRPEPYCHPPPKGFSSRSFLLCRSPSGDVLSTDRQQSEPKGSFRTKTQKHLSICLRVENSDIEMLKVQKCATDIILT